MIGILRANFKSHLDRTKHVGARAIMQQRVFSRRAHSQTLITSVNKRFVIQNLFEQMRLIITLRKNILYGM